MSKATKSCLSAQEIAEGALRASRDILSQQGALDFSTVVYRVILSAITAAVAQDEQFWKNAFLEFRVGLRQALFEKGLMTNPGSADDDLIAMVRSLAEAAVKEKDKKWWSYFWEMFHKLWGQNSAGEYSKATWMDLQAHVKTLDLTEPHPESTGRVGIWDERNPINTKL